MYDGRVNGRILMFLKVVLFLYQQLECVIIPRQMWPYNFSELINIFIKPKMFNGIHHSNIWNG